MKKMISLLLTCIMSLSLAGCTAAGKKPQGTTVTSAVDFYTQVWDAFGEDNQFPCAGGDAEHETEGPAKFVLNEENKETFQYLLHVTDELYDMLEDDVATLQHMMNTNTFSSAVAKLKDPSKASSFAKEYTEAIQNQQWMCGFPDKVTVISVDAYVVIAYGMDELIDCLVDKCSTIAPQSTVLADEPAFVE